MPDSLLITRAREGRSSGAVLKMLLSNIRSRDDSVPVFVFEGPDDLPVYRVWISRVRDGLKYEPLNARGKGQVFDFRGRLAADSTDLARRVFFFVDRDYDDLRGAPAGGDLFCTDRYSTESYLASESVLSSALKEEFRCFSEEERNAVINLFVRASGQFHICMKEVNRRLFYGVRLSIRGTGVEEAIGRYVQVTLHEISVVFSPEALPNLVPLNREPTHEEIEALRADFEVLDPATRHRGKFILGFFLRWLEVLSEERKTNSRSLFSTKYDSKFSMQKMPLDSLASRSEIPAGLRQFLEQV